MDIWQILMTPFSWILRQFIILFDNYGIALLLFTLVVKVVLFPFSLKAKKSSIQMSALAGEQRAIQQRYANNRMKQNEELQKLYLKHDVNPSSGCLWSMLPMFILFPLYGIIRRPFKYLFGLTEEATVAVAKAIGWSDFTVAGMNELSLAARMTESNLAAAQAAANSDKLFAIPFDFFGIDLSLIPNWKFWADGITWGAIGLFLLPIISAGLSIVSSKVTQKTNVMNKEQAQEQSAQMRSMMITMPLMSLWIGFTLPAGLCVYWIANSAFGMLQEVVCGKMLKKDYEEAQRRLAASVAAEKEAEKERRRLAAEKKAAALAEKKSKKKAEPKKESDAPSVNKEDSRIGMRAYARGRAYDPNRYPTFPYKDPSAPKEESAEVTPAEEVKDLPVQQAPVVEAPVVETPAETVVAEDTSADYEAPYAEDNNEE